MLHYCSIEDIQGLTQVAPRFASTFETVRDAVTGLFNAYLRRDLSYSDNVIQYVDSMSLGRGETYMVWLDKKAIDKELPVTVRYHPERLWDNGSVMTGVNIDHENGKLTLYGPMRFGKDTIRISYAGGYKENPDEEGVMLCPAQMRLAAIQQAKFMMSDTINNDAGNAQTDRGRTVVQKQQTIEGLILPVARAIGPWRRTFARVT